MRAPVKAVALLLTSVVVFAQASVDDLQERLEQQRKLILDYGGLIRYGSLNTEVPPPKQGENRVVFLGDELTERWGEGEEKFFPGKPYFNRGIAKQTTSQMLVRFRQDVVSLSPKVVVIQAGANDLAGYTGPATQAMIAENIMSMVDIAKANNIKVILTSVAPVADYFTKQSLIRTPGKIIGVNGWLRDFAKEKGLVYLDVYSVLAEGRNLRKDLTVDGFLWNDAAYRLIAPLAEKAIAEALK